MAKEYTYYNTRTGKVVFRSVEPNYVSKETVDQKVKEKTGNDPRLERHIIECTIRVVDENRTQTFGKFDKHKKMEGL